MSDTPILWDCDEHNESLWHEDKDEAIEYYLDNLPENEWPESTIVYGFAPEVPDWSFYEYIVLEDLIERLDEQYGSPGERTEITVGMKKAAAKFMKAIKTEYEVSPCRRVEKRQVNTLLWVKAHRPDWLTEVANEH